ncbi:hypothetical protein [Paraburkholderia sp. 2C]|jgi:hypothetical protein
MPTTTAHMRFDMLDFSFPDRFTRRRAALDCMQRGSTRGMTQTAIRAESGKGA